MRVVLFFMSIFFVIWTSAQVAIAKVDLAPSKSYRVLPGHVIVKFKPNESVGKFSLQKAQGAPRIQQKMAAFSVQQIEAVFPEAQTPIDASQAELSRIFELRFSDAFEPDFVAQSFASAPEVQYAEPVYLIPYHAIPNDPRFPEQEHLPQIFAPQAWDVTKGSASVIIAVVDTGVDWDHPDLAANIWVNTKERLDGIDNDNNGYIDDIRGWDFVDNATSPAVGEDANTPDNNPMDFDGHGTYVAGLAAGVTNNAVGIGSVGWNCKIMPLRVGWRQSNGEGVGRSDWMAKAFIYAADNGASVINLSYGSSEVVGDAARYAYNKGALVVTSSGNDNTSSTDSFLNTLPFVINVAALSDKDKKANYSSFGPWVTVSAPGGDIFSVNPAGLLTTSFNNTYARVRGTSFAAPLVAGLAGLLKAQNPQARPGDILIQIVETADHIDALNPGYEGRLGSGRINAFRAVTEKVVAEPRLSILQVIIDDQTTGNNNGRLESGETAFLKIKLANDWADASNVNAILQSQDEAVQVIRANSSYNTIPGIASLGSNFATNETAPFEVVVSSDALPHQIEFQLQVSTPTGYSKALDFQVALAPFILLVDDDNGIDVDKYYRAAFDSLKLTYNVWDRHRQGPVSGAVLQNYPLVIWLCEWEFPSLNADDRTAIASYLSAGGNLFLSGQDIGWDLNATDSDINEYYESGGQSKTFFESYLHSRYLLDDSNYSTLSGVPGDPIGDGLQFTVFQPGRQLENQYPDELTPVNGGVSIFNYPNGNSGAVRYSGSYRMVYFGFGGYEGIVQETIRLQVLRRLMEWFSGISVTVDVPKDTENTTQPQSITAHVVSGRHPLSNVNLYWKIQGNTSFRKVPMAAIATDQYQGFIPPQTVGTVTFVVLAKTQNGFFNVIEEYSFFIGADQEPPVLSQPTRIPSQLANKGPFTVAINATDNQEVDPSSGLVHFYSEQGLPDSSALQLVDGIFKGAIDHKFAFSDSVFYYFSVADQSLKRNRGTSELFSFMVGRDDFESDLSAWITADGSGWTLDNIAAEGLKSLRWNPLKYQPGTATIITMTNLLDFSDLKQAILHFKFFHILRSEDYAVLELSRDQGQHWDEISPRYTGTAVKSQTDRFFDAYLSLADFVGAGNENIKLRLRVSLGEGNPLPGSGFYLDQLEISSFTKAKMPAEVMVPQDFSLTQNYPNPFNSSTSIVFAVPVQTEVSLRIYNMHGQLIRSLMNREYNAGIHAVAWDGKGDDGVAVPSGIYFYTLKAANFTNSKKMLLIK